MPDLAIVSARPSLKLAGEPHRDLSEALTSLVIQLPLSGVANAELIVTNWVVSEDGGAADFAFPDVILGKELEVLMGQDEPLRLFKGEITALEERYGDGAPQLIVLLQDKLHRLTRKRQNRVFEEQSLNDVVSSIAGEVGLTADANLSTQVATYHQLNESDMAFLMRMSGSRDIGVRMVDDQLRVRPEEADSDPVPLSAQDSAIKVRLIADLNHQPTKVSVKGYNLVNDEAVTEDGDRLRNPGSGTSAADTLGELGWDGEEIVPQPFPRSQGEAEELAKAHFNRAAKRFISGDIRARGDARLKIGREIELSGVSPRLSGRYQIVNCVHRYDNRNGYETHLKVNRADWQP